MDSMEISPIMQTPTRSPFFLKSNRRNGFLPSGGPDSLCRSGSGGKSGLRAAPTLVKSGRSKLAAKDAATPVPSVKKAYVLKNIGVTPTTPYATPKTTEADRFIPKRSLMNMELSAFTLRGGFEQSQSKKFVSPGSVDYRKRLEVSLAGCLNDGDGDSAKPRVLCFKVTAPVQPEGGIDSTTKIPDSREVPSRGPPRNIKKDAESVLDAPDVVDNFYLQLMDWSIHNLIAVALGGTVFLWNVETGEPAELMSVGTEDEESPYVTGVSWAPDGIHLAIGISTSEIQVWNVNIPQQVRTFKGHSSIVGAMDWHKTILSTGDHAGNILNHDVRAREHIIASLMAHSSGVCGLKWAPTGRMLASGGDDNLVNVWDTATMSSKLFRAASGDKGADRRRNVSSAASSGTGSHVPLLHRFTEHQGAVKALAWCPFQNHLLATGGGSRDCSIRFWNTQIGGCVKSVDAGSQITGLHWSKEDREILSAHGHQGANSNELVVWKYSSLVPLAHLKGHRRRVLATAQGPEGDMVVSLSADESLRFWRVFTAGAGAGGRKKSGSQSEKAEAGGWLGSLQIR